MCKVRLCKLFLAFLICSSSCFGAVYYASPAGSDSDPGTIDQPWRTFKYAQGRLVDGDTLYLRGGTYFESSTVSMSIHGTSSAWITIQSYPGEQAVISGAQPYFMTAPNSEWVVVDSNINLYRTTRTFSGLPTDGRSFYPGAWLVNDDISIIQYGNSANMDSTNYTQSGTNPCYYGPGIMPRSNYLYIRLSPNPNDLTDSSGDPISPVPSIYNPNLIPIAVWTYKNLIYLNTSVAYIHFKDITIAHAGYLIDTGGAVNNIEFDNCKIKYGSYGVLLRGVSSNWYVHDCEFTNGMPDWITWTDVKIDGNPKEAYTEFQSNAFCNGSMVNCTFEQNVFRNIFDGMDVPSGSQNVIVRRNIFKYSKDDAMNIFKNVSNVEVSHNLFWRVASGISCLSSSGGPTAPVYIHHNIIDNSYLLRLGRPVSADSRWGSTRWVTLDPFGSHDSTDKAAWWRLYNNTIITRRNEVYGDPAGPRTVWGNSQKYVYNNIFLSRDARIIFDGSLTNNPNETFATGSHWDGDVVYQMATSGSYPLFNKWGDSSSYTTLAAFRAANPASDWEVTGLEIDPQFDFTEIDNPVYDANIWERYRPANPQVYTAGASYAGLNWPDTKYVNYRGAIPPEGANLNETGLVDFADFAIFAKHWLETGCFAPLYCEGADIDKHDGVNIQDLDKFATDWLN